MRQIKQQKTCLLEQLNPFPEYPTLHLQTKEPSLSVQVALGWHGLLEHSLMSIKIVYTEQTMGDLEKVKYLGHTRFTY